MIMIIKCKDGFIYEIDMSQVTKGAFDVFCSWIGDYDVIDYRVKELM